MMLNHHKEGRMREPMEGCTSGAILAASARQNIKLNRVILLFWFVKIQC